MAATADAIVALSLAWIVKPNRREVLCGPLALLRAFQASAKAQ